MRKRNLMKQIIAVACAAAMMTGLIACTSKPAEQETPETATEEENPAEEKETPVAAGEVVMVGEDGAMSAE